MPSTATSSPLLAAPAISSRDVVASPELLVDLVDMAFGQNACNLLSGRFHGLMAGHLGKPTAAKILMSVQELIVKGEPAGARFLAAFLDVTTPGARLIPRIQGFTSSRRFKAILDGDSRPENPFQTEWRRRFTQVSQDTRDLLMVLGMDVPGDPARPGHEEPWPGWRKCFLTFLDDMVTGRDLTDQARRLMAELVRLETDAWQERTSNLAGTVNPFNTAAVQRVLPILSATDSQVQDLRQMIRWIEEGNDRAAFTNQVSSALEVMDERDHQRLRDLIAKTPGLEILADLSRGLYSAPLEVTKLARGAEALLALTHQMVKHEIRDTELGLLSCVRLVQEHRKGHKVLLPLGGDLALEIKKLLKTPVRERGASLWPLDRLRLLGDQLEVDLSDSKPDENWENFLPTLLEKHSRAVPAPVSADGVPEEEEEEQDAKDMSAAAIKHLVMSNIMSTSVTLGFLRNPKVIGIPGLVADIAARTRNPQIIETIATDRALHTGFANREVARVCLQSPCNVSVKILRKFVHVKYVTKVDLKRMAQDRAGIRREIIREINKYLEALA
nr:hypothetical protein [Candidatus Krumholzibacteria bacterium]